MPSRLTFGIELEFSFATLQPGIPDPESHLPQPVFVLPGSAEDWSQRIQRKFAVFDAIAAKLIAAGLPAQAMTFNYDSSENVHQSSPLNSGGSSRYQDDGVGWIPSRKHKWVWEEHPWAGGGNTGDSDDEIEQSEKRSDGEGNHEEKEEKEECCPPHSPSLRGSHIEYGHEWRVTDDMTIEPTGPRDYDWIPIEVQSPPYIFCDDALQAVKLACHTLTRTFRLQTNASTGLHVHIGHGADGPPYATLRNLMAFLWTFEPQLDQLNPSRRPGISSSNAPATGEFFSWYQSLRRGSCLARGQYDGTHKRPRTVLAGLTAIYSAKTTMATTPTDPVRLYELMRATAWKSAYHLGHVAFPSGGHTIKRTVEFRQHAGTLDGERVAQWVRTIVGIVEFVDEVDGLTLLDFLVAAAGVEDGYVDRGDGMGWRGPQYDVVQLLRDIGLEDCAVYWDKAIPPVRRIMPTPYHSSPRKLERRPVE